MLGLNNYVIVIVVNALAGGKKTNFFDSSSTIRGAALNSIQATTGNAHAKSNIQKQAYPLKSVKTIKDAYGLTGTNFTTHSPYINSKLMDISGVISGSVEIILIKNGLNPREAISAASKHQILPMKTNSAVPRKIGTVLPPIPRDIELEFEAVGSDEIPGPIFGPGNAGLVVGYDKYGDGIIDPIILFGPTGPTGAAGADGADGAVGVTGPIGPFGVGAQGAVGATGADGGSTGATGPDGAAGLDGVDGSDGAAGADGADGAVGVTGVTGPTGATGADGTGTTTFLGLTDTPGSYAGESYKVVVVNPGETALEFVDSAPSGAAAITRALILIDQETAPFQLPYIVQWVEPIYNDDNMVMTEAAYDTSRSGFSGFVVNVAAVYQITGHVTFLHDVVGYRGVNVIINRIANPLVQRIKGTARMRSIGIAGGPMRPSIPFNVTLSLGVGDVIDVQIFYDTAVLTVGKFSVGDDPAEPGAISIVRIP